MNKFVKPLVLYVALVGLVFAFHGTEVDAQTGGDALTAENWGEQVGFKPDLSGVGDFKTGMKVDKSNWEKVKDCIPQNMRQLVTKFNLVMTFHEYTPFHPSLSYIEATNKYHKQVTYEDMGDEARKLGIHNYVAGLPFPNPKNGLEVAYNFHCRYNGDDGENRYRVYWISAKSGVERWEEWEWNYITQTVHRTDVEPVPIIPQFAEKKIMYTSMTRAFEPYDKRGLMALYNRFIEPVDQEGWLYIPTMRRVMKATIGTRGDAWNSTDMLYEDVRGYMGYPEWMHWKLIGKKIILAPMGAGVELGKQQLEKVYDFKTWPYWNPRMCWQPRPMYVLEVIPKFADYPYSRMIIYIDAETYMCTLKECYDKKDELWKIIINGYNASVDQDHMPPGLGTAVAIDLQAEHATAFPWFKTKINQGLDPGYFTLSNLRKMGK